MAKQRKWKQILQELESDPIYSGSRIYLGGKARDWDTCAVGESLTDIAGIRDHKEQVATSIPYLETYGQEFHREVRAYDWKAAQQTLAQIQTYTDENTDEIRAKYGEITRT